jgi:hypothetical protein
MAVFSQDGQSSQTGMLIVGLVTLQTFLDALGKEWHHEFIAEDFLNL